MFNSEREAVYDTLRQRVRHQHTLKELAARKKRKRRWFLAYSLLILATLAGVFWSTSKESSLGAALMDSIFAAYAQEASTASETNTQASVQE